ncbi:Cof-type HAD-IIB family hydrolase [Agrococcus sp. SGAir0287]|uniref:Cof-type HAD-IIB family hydrolase n=1 Tax=Agrococcus sp. SGAir0287 TaxID=2070347 RepID=UPI001586859E|nr:Cof-type HAD-IIB family hydrolase [Agrococcus sp. SGAir0287]
MPHASDARVVFLDVDGTIMDEAARVADSTIEAVRQARANGHTVLLATGRAPGEVPDHVAAIGFDGAITAGGGYAAIGDEQVLERTMDAELVARMVAVFQDAGVEYYLQSREGVYPTEGVHRLYAWYLREFAGETFEGIEPHEHPRVAPLVQREPLPTDHVAKAMFLGEDLGNFARISEALGPDFHVITGTMPNLGTASGEVSRAGVTKGAAIETLLPMLGFTAEQAIGIGDSSNDVEMFDVVGTGIAMADAVVEVRERASESTTGVLDDGIWNAFVRHGLV